MGTKLEIETGLFGRIDFECGDDDDGSDGELVVDCQEGFDDKLGISFIFNGSQIWANLNEKEARYLHSFIGAFLDSQRT